MYLRVSVYHAQVESKFIIQYIQVNFDEADSESKTGDWWEVQLLRKRHISRKKYINIIFIDLVTISFLSLARCAHL